MDCPKDGSRAPQVYALSAHDVSGICGWLSYAISLLYTPATSRGYKQGIVLHPPSWADGPSHSSLLPFRNLFAQWPRQGQAEAGLVGYKKIIDGERLFPVLHSSRERHDDCLVKGECICIFFTGLSPVYSVLPLLHLHFCVCVCC